MWRQYLAAFLVLGAGHAMAQPDGTGSGAQPADAEKPPATDPTPIVDVAPAPATNDGQPTAPDAGAPVPQEPARVSEPKRVEGEGFRFGSYGRVVAGSDLRGGKPEKILITARGPRVVEVSYLELDLSYGFVRRRNGIADDYVSLRPVITIAFNSTLFHETGQFDAQPALRNVFLDARIAKNVTAWAGSRMYRGDDIYLFDYWPLDDINTVGAGARFALPMNERQATGAGGATEVIHDELSVAAHVGFNRLNHPFQFQQVDVPNPVQGATTVLQLNRQRVIASANATYVMINEGAGPGFKAKVHGEVHSLPSGTRERADGSLESLPADRGMLVGAQLGVFGLANPDSGFRRHLNLYARYATGLAAFDELAPPTSFGRELTTDNANELQFGLSGNFDFDYGQVMVGAISRRFIDADTTSTDPDDGWEYSIGARPLARVMPDVFVGGDFSYQARFPRGLNAITLRAEDPAVYQIAPMLVYSPMGPSAYDRPQLRLVYRAAHLNDGARNLYVPDDPRHDNEWVHFLGVQAEWWFNSYTYR